MTFAPTATRSGRDSRGNSGEDAMDLQGRIESIYEFEDGPCPMHYEVRGHVEPADFVVALVSDYGRTASLDAVKQRHARYVPVGRDRPGETIELFCSPGRGAFAVTMVDWHDTIEVSGA